ncbi:hypothetical protein Py04_0302 [Pyrococcus sp. ST04]|nr:hypothetical protein Py04_0302 [Pyrococcus sp. ST04]
MEEVIIRSESSLVKKYEDKLRRRNSYLLIFLGLMIVIQAIVILILRWKYPILGVKMSRILIVFLILVFGLLLIGVLFGQEKEVDEGDLKEKMNAYRIVAKKFYRRLREALENEDMESIKGIADEILEDPIFGKALQVANIGDPKVVAYILYVYLNRESLSREEIEEAKRLAPGPLAKLFEGE